MALVNPYALPEGPLRRMMVAICGLIDALVPIVATIDTTNRPWIERHRVTKRFWALIRQVFAIMPRIEDESVTDTPVFPPLRPRASRPVPKTPEATDAPKAPPTRARYPRSVLSPRQLAKILATILRKLLALAAEAQVLLTPDFHHHLTQLRLLSGCDTLPQKTWETAG